MNRESRAPSARELATTLRDLSWTIHRLVPEAAGLPPLPTTELAVLQQVLATPRITVTALAKHLGMRQSNASAAVRGLVERGLIAREPNPQDRRVIHLTPTAQALADRETIDTVWSGTVRSAMDRLDPQHVAALTAAEQALEALDQVLRDTRHTP